MRKSDKKEFFCACCRMPRVSRYARRLHSGHFIQILVLAIAVGSSLYPWLEWKGFMSLPIIWALYESIHKSLYRKDIKCPFCGFDPTWYKKDVRVARKQVEDFLKQNPESPVFRRARSYENSDITIQ